MLAERLGSLGYCLMIPLDRDYNARSSYRDLTKHWVGWKQAAVQHVLIPVEVLHHRSPDDF